MWQKVNAKQTKKDNIYVYRDFFEAAFYLFLSFYAVAIYS